MPLRRAVAVKDGVTAHTVLATSSPVSLSDFAGLGIIVPAGATGQSVAVYVSDVRDGTYVPLNDRFGTAVAITIAASQAYEIDPAVFAFAFCKFVGAADSTTLKVVLKG